MHTSPPHDTHKIVIAATLWLMHRYQQTGCNKIARMDEQHLRWMQAGASSPVLANVCQRLSSDWCAVLCAAHLVSPQSTLH